MSALHIRDVPQHVIAALKKRAVANQRSLEGELRYILQVTVARDLLASNDAEERNPLGLNTVQVGSSSSFSREEIYDDDTR